MIDSKLTPPLTNAKNTVNIIHIIARKIVTNNFVYVLY